MLTIASIFKSEMRDAEMDEGRGEQPPDFPVPYLGQRKFGRRRGEFADEEAAGDGPVLFAQRREQPPRPRNRR